MTDRRPQESIAGFALVTILLAVMLMTGLSLYLCLEISNEAALASSLDTQLYSLVLAENGIEYARTLLPHAEIPALLRGPDRVHAGTTDPSWRFPVSFSQARALDLSTWVPVCDDGWPSLGEDLLLPRGHGATGEGRFYIRFSNNIKEPAGEDGDGVVVVRSAGIVPATRHDLFVPKTRNDLAMVEAVLRQERTFQLRAALVLFGEEGRFEWHGEESRINGQDSPAVAWIGSPWLERSLLDSLGPRQSGLLQGAGLSPSVRDDTSLYLVSPIYQPIFSGLFWSQFQDNLPRFADSPGRGIQWLPGGGRVEGDFRGVLIARGDLTVSQTDFRGILLHLGGGSLSIEGGTRLEGAVWMSNVEPRNSEGVQHRPLDLRVSGAVSITFDAAAVKEAVAWFPPTQLGWRILFPEMEL